jgi:hypothetical protein
MVEGLKAYLEEIRPESALSDVRTQRHTQGDRVRNVLSGRQGLEGALKRKKIGPEGAFSV